MIKRLTLALKAFICILKKKKNNKSIHFQCYISTMVIFIISITREIANNAFDLHLLI